MTQDSISRLREEASARVESDPRGALQRFQDVLKIDPSNIESWASSASLFLRLGQTDAAADAFTHVLRLAERAKNPEWTNFAHQNLAHLRRTAPQDADRAPAPASAASLYARAAPPESAASRPVSRPVPIGAPPNGTIAPAIASASLTCVAGIGFLMLVVAGAASQLWPYPYVRAALMLSIDNLMSAALLGCIGALALQKAWSRYRPVRILIYVCSGVMLAGAMLMTLRGLLPLGGLFAECTMIENIKPACHIQIEEFEKMPPERRKQLDVLS